PRVRSAVLRLDEWVWLQSHRELGGRLDHPQRVAAFQDIAQDGAEQVVTPSLEERRAVLVRPAAGMPADELPQVILAADQAERHAVPCADEIQGGGEKADERRDAGPVLESFRRHG